MTQSEDIFSLEDLSDLPPELMQEIVGIKGKARLVLKVYLKASLKINISQLLVAYYRINNEQLGKQYAYATAYRLKNKGYLKSGKGKGEYSITKLGKQVLGVVNDTE